MFAPLITFSVLLLLVVGAVWFLIFVFRPRENKSEAKDSAPRHNITVNVPSDWKPLEAPATGGQVLEGARAALWYAVYKHTLDGFEGDMDDIIDIAIRAADRAVAIAFPPQVTPKSRAAVWQEVYQRTFGDAEDYAGVASQRSGMETACQAADAAVDKAFLPEPMVEPDTSEVYQSIKEQVEKLVKEHSLNRSPDAFGPPQKTPFPS